MHNGCVLWGGVGTGKTMTALAYAMERESDKPIIVVTTAKKRDSMDWQREAAMLGIPSWKIQVSSWNKIKDFIEYENHLFIFDEQRLVGAGAWVKSFYKIAKANRWVLLSATPGDTWSDYAPMFIANGWYKNITDFRRQHAVYSTYTTFPKIERWINEGKLQKFRKHLLVEMPMVRHTTRHLHYVDCTYDQDILDVVRKRRWNVYTDEPLVNAAEMYSVLRKVVSTDPSRREALFSLAQEHDKLIVFYNFNYELEILRNLCREIQESSSTVSTYHRTDSTQNVEESNLDLPPWDLTKEELEKWNGISVRTNQSESQSQPTTSMGLSGSSISPHTSWLQQSANGGMNLNPTRSSMNQEFETSSEKRYSESESNQISEQSTKSSKTFGWAEWNGHKHQEIPQTDRWIYLVQYLSGSEGWNCTETDAMAFWSLTYSWKQFNQAQGRIDRLNTPYEDLHYYVLMTDSIAEKPVIRALNQKKDFQPK